MIRNGIDIIAIDRIEKSVEKLGAAFLTRIYTPAEIELCQKKNRKAMESFAGRFAAKEAISKALGTGIGGEGVSFTDMEILADEKGRPVAVLSGNAKKVYENMQGKDLCVSISHDGGIAIAVCHIEYDGASAEGEA